MKKPKVKKNPPEKSTQKPNLPSVSDQDDLSDIRDDIEQVLEGVVNKGKKGEVVEGILQVVGQEIFSGPLPHPKHIKAYEDVCPGMADRIMTMAEKSQDAQLQIPNEMIRSESTYRLTGLCFGFATMIILVGASLLSLHMGHPLLAASFITVGTLGIIGKFIEGRIDKRRANEEFDN